MDGELWLIFLIKNLGIDINLVEKIYDALIFVFIQTDNYVHRLTKKDKNFYGYGGILTFLSFLSYFTCIGPFL